ncbi:hypothetical protein BJV78DRAFT_681406 [Lactifluus subvellereus]|nr:hypothetical protein BJV78DRAFT_681406 [Lactifluus subvellereus]
MWRTQTWTHSTQTRFSTSVLTAAIRGTPRLMTASDSDSDSAHRGWPQQPVHYTYNAGAERMQRLLEQMALVGGVPCLDDMTDMAGSEARKDVLRKVWVIAVNAYHGCLIYICCINCISCRAFLVPAVAGYSSPLARTDQQPSWVTSLWLPAGPLFKRDHLFPLHSSFLQPYPI